MLRKIYFSFLLIFVSTLLCLPAIAGVLKGVVKDSKGNTLPFASVYVKGSTIGTSASVNGEYFLNLSPGSYDIMCQFIGYKQVSYKVNIKGNETITHDFVLQEQDLQIKEVVIKAGEDPAYYIMRQAIARRKFHNDQYRSLQTGIYLKGVMRNRGLPDKLLGRELTEEDKKDVAEGLGLDSSGKGVLYLVEEVATYYAREDKTKTIIHSVKESGDPQGLGFAQMPPVISFYENNINLAEQLNPRGFISPVNDNAFHYYRFKYEGEFKEGNYIINKIQVIPKRQFEPLFFGHIYIVENDWAIHSLDLYTSKRNGLEMLDTLGMRQQFIPMGKDLWVIKNQVWYPAVKLLGVLDITGHFVTVYDDQKVNKPIPDSIFADKMVSVYDKAANKKDSSYWQEARPIALEKDEMKDYRRKDSIYNRVNSPEYIDSVRKRNNRQVSGLLTTGYTYVTKERKHTFTVSPILLDWINFNTIEGWNVAPKIWWTHRIDTGRYLHGKAAVRYGFNNTHFNAIGRLTYQRNSLGWRGRSWNAGIDGGKYVFQFNSNNPIPNLFNTFTTLFYGRNHLKLYERWQAGAFFNRNFGNGLRFGIRGEFQRRMPLQNTTFFTWAEDDKVHFTDNIPSDLTVGPSIIWEEHNAVLFNASISYRPGYTYAQYPDYKVAYVSRWPEFTISYTKGIPNLFESKTNYDKWRVSIEDVMRLKMLGSLSYNIAAGGFLNTDYVSIPDMMHIDGNQLSVATPYLRSFQLAPYYRFSNTEELYGEAHLEYNLEGLLTNKIPLFRRLRWHLVTGANTFYANPNLYYTEAFVGLDNIGWGIFRLFRLDYVHSWDSFGEQHDGLRIGLKMQGLNVSTPVSDEW